MNSIQWCSPYVLTPSASIPLEQVEAFAASNGVVAHLEAAVAGEANGAAGGGNATPEGDQEEGNGGEGEGEGEGEEEEEEEEEEDSEDVRHVPLYARAKLTLHASRMSKLSWNHRPVLWTSGT